MNRLQDISLASWMNNVTLVQKNPYLLHPDLTNLKPFPQLEIRSIDYFMAR